MGQTNTWAWNGRLTSQFEANGRAVHRAEYLLENSGEAQIGIRIPTGCSPLGIDVDGTAVSDMQMLDLAGFITVPLPEGSRFPHVEVTYTSSGEGLGIWGSASIEFPELSVPVLSRRWTVWLPPGYRATNDNRNAWPRHENNYTWKQRIFGALAALPEQPPFRLFSAEDWSSLFGREKDEDPSTLNAQLTLQILGEQLIDLHAASNEQLPVTWRRLLVAYQHRVNASAARYPSTVWVDQAQLSEAGISLDAVVAHAMANSPVESAISALVQANLAIVAADDSLLLTSTDGLSRYAPSPETLENRAVALARGKNPLSRQLHRSSSDLAAGLVPLSSWIAQPAVPSSPWNQRGRSRTMGLMNAQWRHVRRLLGCD